MEAVTRCETGYAAFADPDEMRRLYELYFPLVHRTCYRYTKNRVDADDLAQEVFLKLHARYGSFGGHAQISTWLYRVTVNHCLDHLRWKKRQGELLTGYAEESIRREPSGSPSGHPAKRLLRRLLENMDEANRQVVFLRFEVGLTHEEIAEICGVSRVAITKRLAKFQAGLAPFKDSLRQDLDEAGFAAQSQMAVRQAKDVEDC